MTAILEPPTVTTGSPPPAAEPRQKRVLTATGVRVLGAVLVTLFTVEQLLYPSVAGDPPPLTAGQAFVVTVMTLLMLGALAGFVAGRRWALPTALAFSVAEAVNVVLCPATGHHVIGWWWYAQAAVTGVMIALSGLALART